MKMKFIFIIRKPEIASIAKISKLMIGRTTELFRTQNSAETGLALAHLFP